ncbi:MAG: tRNA pseudouridine(55) synthase TruB [Deltaproteobacteria bacterium]|jgi:tRNA pseudouridine55 synthase|nr:tRNA pseudouridine(55) synthase TruB [Deltaproteobacteria bacterium]
MMTVSEEARGRREELRGGGRRGPEAGGRSEGDFCGLLLFDKPQGATTFSLVRETRRHLGVRKAGHVGTLDPLATGLAGVLAGPAAKLAPLVMGCDKVYTGEIRLGLDTDTQDVTGRVLSEYNGPFPGIGPVREALEGFLGIRPQRPPLFSAVKVAGVPSYRAARRGEARDPLPERPALMRSCELIGWDPPVLRFRIEVGSGFYVRSLARDLGEALGLGGGALQALRRETLGPFGLSGALTPPYNRESLAAALIAPRDALPDHPEYPADEGEAEFLRRGARLCGARVSSARLARLPGSPLWPGPRGGYPAGTVIVTLRGALVALAEFCGPGGPSRTEGPDAPPEDTLSGGGPNGRVGEGQGRTFDGGSARRRDDGRDRTFDGGTDHRRDDGRDRTFDGGTDHRRDDGRDRTFDGGTDHRRDDGTDSRDGHVPPSVAESGFSTPRGPYLRPLRVFQGPS